MIIRFKLDEIKLSSGKLKALIKEKINTKEMENYIERMVEDTLKSVQDIANRPNDTVPEWAKVVSVEIMTPKPASVGYPIYESEEVS